MSQITSQTKTGSTLTQTVTPTKHALKIQDLKRSFRQRYSGAVRMGEASSLDSYLNTLVVLESITDEDQLEAIKDLTSEFKAAQEAKLNRPKSEFKLGNGAMQKVYHTHTGESFLTLWHTKQKGHKQSVIPNSKITGVSVENGSVLVVHMRHGEQKRFDGSTMNGHEYIPMREKYGEVK